MGIKDSSAFNYWFMMHSDKALEVINWMASTPEFFEQHDKGHLNTSGHKLWSDCILKTLS